MSTKNPIPSTDPTDIVFNSQKLDEVLNGNLHYYTDRLGVSRRTVEGINAAADVVLAGLGYAPPVAYASGILLTLTTQTVEYSGLVYAPKAADLPFTTSGTFETAKFRPIQGVSSADLAASGGAAMVGYIQAGTGAVATTVQAKLHESVSVSGFETVQEAVAHAYLNNVPLYWPSLVEVSSNIPNFHAVRHYGPGGVIRGADTFYVDPASSNTNTVYVSTGGSSINDGLSSSLPVSTLQLAINTLTNYGPLLKGAWVIKLGAGTYARGRFPDSGIVSENPISVSGPDVGGFPNIPTAIISEGSNGVSAEGMRIRNGTRINCTDLHFIGFNGTTSSGGLTSGGFCQIYSVNCHYTNCTWGISGTQHSLVDVKGGIFDGCGFKPDATLYSSGGAIRGLFLTKFSVGTQNAGSLVNGPIFRNNNFGIFAQEHIDGHLDWCTFEDNIHCVRLNICSRLNLDGSSFKRSAGAAIWAQENSVVSYSGNTTFGAGADANHINVICNNGAVTNPDLMMSTAIGHSTTERCIAREIINQTVNSISNTVVYQTTLISQMWRDGSSSVSGMKKLRFKIYGTLNGTSGFKRPQMRFGATQNNVTFTSSETGIFECEGQVLINTNPIGNQLQIIKASRNGGASIRMNINEPLETLVSDTNFNIEALVENANDSIFINAFEVWVDGL